VRHEDDDVVERWPRTSWARHGILKTKSDYRSSIWINSTKEKLPTRRAAAHASLQTLSNGHERGGVDCATCWAASPNSMGQWRLRRAVMRHAGIETNPLGRSTGAHDGTVWITRAMVMAWRLSMTNNALESDCDPGTQLTPALPQDRFSRVRPPIETIERLAVTSAQGGPSARCRCWGIGIIRPRQQQRLDLA